MDNGIIPALKGIIGVLTGINVFIASVIAMLVRPIYKRLNQVEGRSQENEKHIAVLCKDARERKENLQYIRDQIDMLVKHLLKGRR